MYRSFVHLQVTPLVERCRVPLAFKGVFRVAKRQFSVSKVQALRRARWGGSLALELLRLAVSSGQNGFSPDETSLRCFPSGQTRFSPDETALRCITSGQTGFSPDETASRGFPSGQNHDLPDGRSVRLAHQIHFGSQCAPEVCKMAPPCQGGAKKVSLWQVTLNRVHSTLSALPK